MANYESNRIVALVNEQGRARLESSEIPIYTDIKSAMSSENGTAYILMGNSQSATKSTSVAMQSGAKIIVLETRDLNIEDLNGLRSAAKKSDSIIIGPDTSGLITPGLSKFGLLSHEAFRPGKISVVTRSGSMLYEAATVIGEQGLGIRIGVDLGAYPGGTSIVSEVIDALNADSKTQAILFIDEFGHPFCANDANAFKHRAKPIYSLIYPKSIRVLGFDAGRVKISSSGALHEIRRNIPGSVEAKQDMLTSVGIPVFDTLHEMVRAITEPFETRENRNQRSISYYTEKTGVDSLSRQLEAQLQSLVLWEFGGQVGIISLGGGVGFYALDLLKTVGLEAANFSDFGNAFSNVESLLPRAFELVTRNQAVRSLIVYAPIGGLFEPLETLRLLETSSKDTGLPSVLIVPGYQQFEKTINSVGLLTYNCLQHAVESNLDLLRGL
jgi:succinyl-CoA synthetase alpha subunit